MEILGTCIQRKTGNMKKAIFVLGLFISIGGLAQTVPLGSLPPPPPISELPAEPPPVEPPMPEELAQFLKQNPSVATVHWSDNGQKIIFKFKDGRKKKYDLSIRKQKEEVIKLYGSLPLPPPLPPAPPVVH